MNGLIERRMTVQAEMRVDDQGRVEGYAAVFDQLSEDLGGFREKVRPGTFTKTLQEADVRALFNHDANFVLGRNRAGTLELAQDSRGLHFRATPPGTQLIQDLVLAPIRRGDVNGASFSFRAIRDDWRRADHGNERELIEAELYDVGPVTFPAYPQTSAQVRSLAAIDSFLRGERAEATPDLIRSLIEQLEALLPTAPGQAPHPVDEGGTVAEPRARLDVLRCQLELAELI